MKVVIALLALALAGCSSNSGAPQLSNFERFEQSCKDMKGFVVRVEPPGWNDTGRYDCIVDGKKVYVPDATEVLQ
jgi:hypothetical protein